MNLINYACLCQTGETFLTRVTRVRVHTHVRIVHGREQSTTLTTRLCVENVSFSRSMTPRNAPETRSSGGQRPRRCLVALDETSPDRPAGSTETERMPILRFGEYKIARRLWSFTR